MQFLSSSLKPYECKSSNDLVAINVEATEHAERCTQVSVLDHRPVGGLTVVGNKKNRCTMLVLSQEVLARCSQSYGVECVGPGRGLQLHELR